MVRIFKFRLPEHGEATIDANVVRWLHVEWVRGVLQVWAEVATLGPGETPMRCRLAVALTGDEPPASAEGYRSEHIGSAVLEAAARHPSDLVEVAAAYVVHVYRVWP